MSQGWPQIHDCPWPTTGVRGGTTMYMQNMETHELTIRYKVKHKYILYIDLRISAYYIARKNKHTLYINLRIST